MAYTADDTLSNDAAFRGRVRMAMVNAARQIATEARTVKAALDVKRNVLAVKVLNDPASYVDRFVQASIEAGTLVSGSTDANLDTAISGVWNGIAGITAQDNA